MRRMTRRDSFKHAAGLAAGVAAIRLRDLLALAVGQPAGRPAALPERVLGKTGVKVSILGLGGVGFLIDLKDKDAVAALITAAVDAGIRFFDTAFNYGEGAGEEHLGLVMGTARRKDVFLATKCESRSYDGAMRQVELSLKRLKTDRLDLIQVHHVHDQDDLKSLLGKDGVVPALEKLRDQKTVRFIGMTGHPGYPRVKEALEAYPWDTFQGFVNPEKATRPALDEQIPLARRKGMGIIAMKVFGGGTPARLVGAGPGRAPAALLLRYALSQPITLAVPAISSREHLEENVRVVRDFTPLSEAEIKALEEKFGAAARG